MMYLAYSLAGYLATPLLQRWLKKRQARGKEDGTRLPERLGIASQPRPEGCLIWLHAASVGETQSVLTLVRALLARHPQLHLLITTGTVTSAALVAQQQLPRVIHQFIPIDTFSATRRFLQHWHPTLALWVESEFWPQLLWQVQRRHIPALLINARLSEKSARNWARFPTSIRSILATFLAVYAGSADDAARLTSLGADNVNDIGNLKYDADPLPANHALLNELAASTQGRPVWVAASTHAGEEALIVQAHQLLVHQHPHLLTIIVPRHATRGDSLAAELRAQGITLAQRSHQQPITPDTGLYLADTMGELGTFFRFSDIVFLGGSLIPHGGHNPLEPARLHCAILSGPYTHNFSTIMQRFAAQRAISIVRQAEELAAGVHSLLSNDSLRLAMAERALEVVDSARGASTRILEHIDALLPAEDA